MPNKLKKNNNTYNILSHNDQIDLLILFEIAYKSKITILGFIAMALLCALAYLQLTAPIYESKLSYSINNVPHQNFNEISEKFKNNFYSENIFLDWKKNNKSEIIFGDFSPTIVIDGYTFSREDSEKLATINTIKKEGPDITYILVKTNNLSVIDDFFNYAKYVNDFTTKEFMLNVRDDLEKIKNFNKETLQLDDRLIEKILLFDRFLLQVESGNNIYSIEFPSLPYKVSPSTRLILFISVFFGGFVGILFVTLNNFFKNNKNRFL